jgi:hypothetical protein
MGIVITHAENRTPSKGSPDFFTLEQVTDAQYSGREK